MDKFTLFELHVHDGMEFNATNTAPAIGGSEEAVDALEEYVDADTEDVEMSEESDADEDDGSSRSRLPLVVGLVLVVLVGIAVRKLLGGDTELEVAELDDLVDEAETYEEAEP